MNKNSIWQDEDWLKSARSLVSWANSVPNNDSILLLVRHSHRMRLETYDEMVKAGLTDLGKNMAYQFGLHLPKRRPTRIFFSFVSRCYETAEKMRQGLIESGNDIEEFEPLPSIVGPQDAKQAIWDNLHPDGENVTEFVNKWAAGEFGKDIEPFDTYLTRLRKDTIERLKQDQRGALQIYVTHDLCLMSAKRFFLKTSLEKGDREPYLGGIGFQQKDTGLCLYNRKGTIRITD